MKTATKAALLALIAILLPACASSLVLGKDYWIDRENRIFYGRTSDVVNEMCFIKGGAFFGKNGRRVVWADGCNSPSDDVMILPLEAASPKHYIHRHELKHRYDGAWHD